MISTFLAVDTSSYTEAREWLFDAGDHMEVKFGLQLFYAQGAEKCATLRNIGANRRRQMFLDLKLHDIPTTVAGAIRSVLDIEPSFITVHACDGIEILQAARKEVDEAPRRGLIPPKLLAITVLSCVAAHPTVLPTVAERAMLARNAGFDGLVCSPLELQYLRQAFGPGFTHWKDMYLMSPGIYPAGTFLNDQARVATAREAMDAGANGLVIGRSITQEANRVQAMMDILDTLK